MPRSHWVAYRLDGPLFLRATAAFSDVEGVLRAIESHFRNTRYHNAVADRWRTYPDLMFQRYASDGDPWDASLVLVHPDQARRMLTLAVYKICHTGDDDSPGLADDESPPLESHRRMASSDDH